MAALSAISHHIWDLKYRLRDAEGRPLEGSIEESWARVAKTLAAPEADGTRDLWQQRFQDALSDFQFLPAGRILAGAGSGRAVTLFNCFVMGTIPDDMDGIFENLREAALTLQQGGGIGYDFSTLRPKGAIVRGVGADASGPISFMEVWDAMCRTIMSAGARRGAMMATLACDHPDIEDFLTAKGEAGRLTNFNLSVLVSDAFLAAVEADAPWPLVFGGETYRVVEAAALWERMMRATYEAAEPGVIFIDQINRRNNLHYCETIRATNPCGEQPLPPYGACLLGSINLARLVTAPFEAAAGLAEERLETLVATALRMLDNAIDSSRFPLEAQRREAEAKRRVGLGITGLADALMMVGLRYGGADAAAQAGRWMRVIKEAAYRASAELAAEKGAFPLFESGPFLAGETPRALPEDLRAAIARDGLRNALLTSIAPTGTISLLADNVSSGLEPVFSFEQKRAILRPDGTREETLVSDYAYRLFHRLKGPDAQQPPSFVESAALTPEEHLVMQAAVQAEVDASVSKTINLPSAIDFDAFKSIYHRAYELGCKGCTTYRPSALRGSVLEPATAGAPAGTTASTTAAVRPVASLESPEVVAGEAPVGSVVYMAEPLARPEALPGTTYKLRWPDSAHAIYITLNDIVQDGRRRPFEIFINSKNMEHYAWTLALTRMISAVFRRGGDLSFVVEELQAVFDPRGGAWLEGRYIPSLLAAIGRVIQGHMIAIGFMAPPETAAGAAALSAEPQAFGQCPHCGQAALLRQEGCDLCTACNYSRCA